MPDRHGFNLLGESVRCIDCETGGPIWRWPERKRRRHARAHRAAARAARRTELRRRRTLLAPPLARTSNEEKKEVATMANPQATTGEPAKQVAIDVLREAGEPLHAKEIAKRVIDSGRTRLGGKTPEQTITAMLAVGSKPGGPFTRVDKGTYALAEAATAPAEEGRAEKEASKVRPRRRQKQAPTA